MKILEVDGGVDGHDCLPYYCIISLWMVVDEKVHPQMKDRFGTRYP